MESLLRPIARRFGQPIVMSFCIAWIFWNWEIVVGLIWYNSETLPNYGYNNFKSLIHANSNCLRNYVWPGIIAIGYPFATLLFNNFGAWVQKLDGWLFFKISKDAYVKTDYFLQAKEALLTKEKKISSFIMRENEMEQKILELERNLEEASFNINELDSELRGANQTINSQNKMLDEFQQQISQGAEKSRIEYILGDYSVLTVQDYEEEEHINNADILLRIFKVGATNQMFIEASSGNMRRTHIILEYMYDSNRNSIYIQTESYSSSSSLKNDSRNYFDYITGKIFSGEIHFNLSNNKDDLYIRDPNNKTTLILKRKTQK